MRTRRRTRAKAVTLTISALLGLGALAGCTGNGRNGGAPHRAGQDGPSLLHHTRLVHHMMRYIG
jgi:hypothetical protein